MDTRPESDHAKEDARLLALIRESWLAAVARMGYAELWVTYAKSVGYGVNTVLPQSCGHRSIKVLRGYKVPLPMAGRPSLLAPNQPSESRFLHHSLTKPG